MTTKNKQELIAQVVALLSVMIEVNEPSSQITITENKSQSIEMLTVKECTEAIKGLSEHTVRQLVVQEKLPYIRTGQGQRGKILISKNALLSYFGGAA
ncbi:MAG: DNA-binding protein [Oscillospiraceae bacterium]|nr:DNA-binding protein [Oscillospiraceae bacterium]